MSHLRLVPQPLATVTELPLRDAADPEDAREYSVTWTIDSVDASSPEDAARKVWEQIFGRQAPGPDDACVFTITHQDDAGRVISQTIDLSEDTDNQSRPLVQNE